MFTKEQEAAFQKEMDGIAEEVQEDKKVVESDDSTDHSHESTEVDHDDLDTDNDDVSDESVESDNDGESEDKDSEDDEKSDDDVDQDEVSEDDEDTDETVVDKKAQSKDVRKSIARQARKHEAETAQLHASIARLEQAIARNSNTQPQQGTNQPLNADDQRQARFNELVNKGYDQTWAANQVAYEDDQAQTRSRQEALNQSTQAQQKLHNSLELARSKVQSACIVDPELKKLGEAYRGPVMSEAMQMALGHVEKPGRTLKHILKNDPKFIERLGSKPAEDQYAQMLILSGRLEAQREFQKQNKPKSNPKPPPTGKVGSRGQKSDGNDPMRWSEAKLHREMGLS